MFSDLSPSFGTEEHKADSAVLLSNGGSKNESRSTHLLCVTRPRFQGASVLSGEAKYKQVQCHVIFAATGSELPGTGKEQSEHLRWAP